MSLTSAAEIAIAQEIRQSFDRKSKSTVQQRMGERWKARGTLQLKIESVGRSMIVYCQGRLVWSQEGTFLKAIFFMQDYDRLTLDLAGVPSIDACGLGALATVAKWALRKKVELVISNPTRRVHELIHLVGIEKTVIQMCRGKVHKLGHNRPTSIAMERKLAREERERLCQAQADLAHTNRVTTMGELTASLAHEIRQPISAAVINAKTCLRWLGRDDPDVAEAREAASRIVKDVTRAVDIIGRISLLFKKGGLQRELVDINELIRETIVLLRSEASRYAISIRTEFAEDLPEVMADRVQLQQVLMNLMLNGIDAMKDTGKRGELTIKSQQDETSQLLISVGDTGVGLEPKQAEQIFNAFFTTKPQGTGMGLPISRAIIESHGGRLWATAHSGRGATFQFTLPREVTAHLAA